LGWNSEPGRRRLNSLPLRPRTRFAPSPTGYLHLGHVANAIHVWGIARSRGGQVLLRLEDHDRGRCRAEYEEAILEDLQWLGLEPDIGSPGELRGGEPGYRQSDNSGRYEAALENLRTSFQVYACGCSRKDNAGDLDLPDQETRYSGRCRGRGLAPGPGLGVRVALEAGTEQFTDGILGAQQQAPFEQCGDLLLRDRLGNWTYQFAVTVDDLEHNIDLVIRGQDLLASTGRQIRLGRMLGRSDPPAFLHHPLIRHGSGVKLSKANRDTGVRDLRAEGIAPEWVLGQAARLTGLTESFREIQVQELAGLFDLR
jgi:glutamyl-tRNA synthetase/glutamyl-Q tRNA(Asp) synthetase